MLGPLLFLIYINDLCNCTNSLDLHLFADDSNLFFCHKSLVCLEKIINTELAHVETWLNTNKLSLNISKSNFVIFHPPQKKVNDPMKLYVNDTLLEEKNHVKYLGIMMDNNLNWKSHATYIAKKNKGSIGILSKLRYYVTHDTLITLYFALLYPFLIYGILIWGNTYPTNIKLLFILQKRAIRLITFSKFDEHTSPLFKITGILTFFDLVTLHISLFMFKFHKILLPTVFDTYFRPISTIHNYRTRPSSKDAFSLPRVRTNYGIFNIRFSGVKVWNALEPDIKLLSMSAFKARLKSSLISKY